MEKENHVSIYLCLSFKILDIKQSRCMKKECLKCTDISIKFIYGKTISNYCECGLIKSTSNKEKNKVKLNQENTITIVKS